MSSIKGNGLARSNKCLKYHVDTQNRIVFSCTRDAMAIKGMPKLSKINDEFTVYHTYCS
jgi:hypothetical protein